MNALRDGVPAYLACPRCGRRVRLTARELDARQGFCASCDARFALDAPVLHGDGPGRALLHVGATLPTRTTRRRLVVHSQAPLEIELRKRRSGPFVVGAAFTGLLVAGVELFGSVELGMAMASILGVAGSRLIDPMLRRSQHLRLEPGRLTLLTLPGSPTVALDPSVELVPSPSGTLTIVTRDATHVLGGGLSLSLADALWLRDLVRDACRPDDP